MSRPIEPKEPSEHLVTLTRMLRQVEVDERYEPRKKARLRVKLGELMGEFQKEVVSG